MPAPVPTDDATLNEAVELIRTRVERMPEVALVLGSGLGVLAEDAEDTTIVPAADIPGYPESTVEGHDGQLVFGTLEGTDVVFVQGRVHFYEGHPVQALAFPVRLVNALGAERILVTNAAGGINHAFEPGTLMFITDHINMALTSPLIGQAQAPRAAALEAKTPVTRRGPYYDRDWVEAAEGVARKHGISTQRGTYIWTKGPSYETKAEIRAFERMGADAVGMSTVPEVIQAHQLGMRVLGISTITNLAAGLSAVPLDHADVLEVGKRVRKSLSRLVRGIVRETL